MRFLNLFEGRFVMDFLWSTKDFIQGYLDVGGPIQITDGDVTSIDKNFLLSAAKQLEE